VLPVPRLSAVTVRLLQPAIFFRVHKDLQRKENTMPVGQRLGYIEEIVQLAKGGECPQLRKILTMPKLIRPNPQEKHLFYLGRSSFCTISQAADRYCRSSPWKAGVAAVVRGEVPDPPTGEITEEVSVVRDFGTDSGLN